MYGYIYKTTNIINGKIYIGKHKNSKHNKKYFGSGKILKQSIDKYGLDNFTNEIVCWCYNEEELNEKEKFYIHIYMKFFDCYNISEGGDGGNLMKFHSSERRALAFTKMVKTRKENCVGVGTNNAMYRSGERGIHPLLNKKHSEETKSKISNSLRGNIPWNKGTAKIKTEEEKAEIKLERYLENNHITPIKVVNLDNNEEMYFSSKKECEDFFCFSIKYRLKVGKLKNENLTFEKITTKEYVDKKELSCMARPKKTSLS